MSSDDAQDFRTFFSSLGLHSRDQLNESETALANEVATYFTSQRLRYVDIAGLGRHGGALVFKEEDENNAEIRRIIIKYSIGEEADIDLVNEAYCLEMLRGAEHIVQIIPIDGASLNVSGTGRRPTMALEFIPYGTAHVLLQKIRICQTYLPNRLLWRILLCLARQLTAMAYPPRGEPNAPVSSERIVPGSASFGLTQNSCHLNNFVLGDLSPDAEHSLVPIVKLIDFGRGKMAPAQEAYYANLSGAGYMVMALASPELTSVERNRHFRKSYNDYELKHGPNAGEMITTSAHPDFLARQDLDPLLQDTIARMLSQFLNERPDLAELVQICEDAVAHRELADFENEHTIPELRNWETDDGIRQLVQTLILDADVPGGPLPDNQQQIEQDSQMGASLQGLGTPTLDRSTSQQTVAAAVADQPTLFGTFTQTVNMMRQENPVEEPGLLDNIIDFIFSSLR
ncbi:hypothetical protein F4776DRAFT_488153 [Hypoxylon sp. NC0597]|nr:hypothetical protein F4776DRAFT_488153 [Hypoxylon sp. NC0597]